MIVKKDYENLDDSLPYQCKIVDESDDAISICYGYKRSIPRSILYYFLCLCTAGFLILLSYWKPNIKLYLTHVKCPLHVSTKVLLVDQYESLFIENVVTENNQANFLLNKKKKNLISNNTVKSEYSYFWHKRLKYYYDISSMSFISVETVNKQNTFYDLHQKANGLGIKTRNKLLSWFGLNKIDVKVKSYIRLFLEESSNPFYIFQVYSCALWFSDEYYYYSATIVFISVLSILITIYQTRHHLQELHDMIVFTSQVQVITPNSGGIIDIDAESLVPGDVIVIPRHGGTLHCDAVLLNGNVIVNESMLTGESIPITKVPISNPTNSNDPQNGIFDSLKHKRNTLFCGTEVLQTRYYGEENVCAVVVKTGFNTMKGNLIRSILFPKPIDFQFLNDALKFVAVLSILGVVGIGFSAYKFASYHAELSDVLKNALDVITIAVPPALPAALSVGTVYSIQRLRKKKIFCISPSRINMSGKIKLFCFDKTGTLTEEGLDFCGVLRSTSNDFMDLENDFKNEADHDLVLVGMATCHSLTILDNEICGDPLDEKMFFVTDWEIEEAGTSETERYGNIVPTVVRPKSSAVDSIRIKYIENNSLPLEVAVLKQYTFSSELQRMSVIVRRLGAKNMEVFAKGAPEMIASLCKDTSIPSNFEDTLMYYAKQGYRVIAIAHKPLSRKIRWHKLQNYRRSQVECDLNLLGFIIFKNVLKPESKPIIKQLYKAHIRSVMVTGDNLLTAVSVARECGMVKPDEKIISITLADSGNEPGLNFSVVGELDNTIYFDLSCEEEFYSANFLQRNYHLAVTGKVFDVILTNYPTIYDRLMVCGTIFARMLPDQKTTLIESLQCLGYGVGMCGDGANDCGALKRAHAGISLSDSEASVASPFTSKVQNISCVIEVIKEGRCALVTAFSTFKYMALYSMIQFASVLILFHIKSNLGDIQYLYIDLFIIIPLAVTMGQSGPSNKLCPQRPLGRLVHPFVLFSVIAQVIVQIVFQLMIYFYVPMLPSYVSIENLKKNSWVDGVGQIESFENTGVFVLTAFQYFFIAVIFSVGRPHRKEFYTNKAFIVTVAIFFFLNCSISILPCSFLQDQLQVLRIKDRDYYLTLYGLIACNILVSYIIDNVLLNSTAFRKILKSLLCKKHPRNKYKLILKEIVEDSEWPMLATCTEDPGVVC